MTATTKLIEQTRRGTRAEGDSASAGTLRTPIEAQGITLPVPDRRTLELPLYASGRMSWADHETALSLATLESIRRLLADETSQLVLLSEIVQETGSLLSATVDRAEIARTISDWKMFPLSEYAIEATPRRLGAVIEKYRQIGKSQGGIVGVFLEALGTNEYVDRLTDSEEEWSTYREGGIGGSPII